MRPMLASPAAPLIAMLVCLAACRGDDGGSSAASSAAPSTRQAAAQEPPPAVRHEEHVFAGGIAPPAATLDNPFKDDRASAAQGEKLFGAMNCDGCHGGGATGWVGPSLADGRWRYGGADAEIFQSIYHGRPHGMPAFGGIIPREGIWRIVTYLRSLQPPADVPTESWR